MKRLIKPAVLVFVVGMIVFGGIYLHSSSLFRITQVNPPNDILPTSQRSIRLTFNRALKANQSASGVVVENTQAEVIFHTKDIVILLSEPPTEGNKIKVSLSNILSSSNEQLTKTLYFTVKYVPFNKLSKESQQSAIEATDSTERTHPLIGHLPYETDDFSIDYQLPSVASAKVPLYVSSKLINYNDPFAAPDSPSSLQLLRRSRDETIEWMSANGYKPDDYQLVFSEPYLLDEYGGVYVGDYTPESNRD
jgi:hypothetical protein